VKGSYLAIVLRNFVNGGDISGNTFSNMQIEECTRAMLISSTDDSSNPNTFSDIRIIGSRPKMDITYTINPNDNAPADVIVEDAVYTNSTNRITVTGDPFLPEHVDCSLAFEGSGWPNTAFTIASVIDSNTIEIHNELNPTDLTDGTVTLRAAQMFDVEDGNVFEKVRIIQSYPASTNPPDEPPDCTVTGFSDVATQYTGASGGGGGGGADPITNIEVSVVTTTAG
jgi:hypothetical protein